MAIILLIDDHPIVRNGTAEFLEAYGYVVISCNNGDDGVRLANEHRPHLILCDVNMPQMTGYEVLKRLKQYDWFEGIPFFFLSALAEEHEVNWGIKMGATGFFIKPFDPDELVQNIENLLKQK